MLSKRKNSNVWVLKTQFNMTGTRSFSAKNLEKLIIWILISILVPMVPANLQISEWFKS